MFTYSLMLALIIFMAALILYGIKICEKKESFMSANDTNFLRGFWCIVVVLVHIPDAYQNWIQNMIGSFAYIGVTFFFMTSAYGLKYSSINKQDYLLHFWRKRLPALLIPNLITNGIALLLNSVGSRERPVIGWNILRINSWVKVLLFYYLLFWIIYRVLPQYIRGGGGTGRMGSCVRLQFCVAWL